MKEKTTLYLFAVVILVLICSAAVIITIKKSPRINVLPSDLIQKLDSLLLPGPGSEEESAAQEQLKKPCSETVKDLDEVQFRIFSKSSFSLSFLESESLVSTRRFVNFHLMCKFLYTRDPLFYSEIKAWTEWPWPSDAEEWKLDPAFEARREQKKQVDELVLKVAGRIRELNPLFFNFVAFEKEEICPGGNENPELASQLKESFFLEELNARIKLWDFFDNYCEQMNKYSNDSVLREKEI